MAQTLQVLATHSYPGYQFMAGFSHQKYNPEPCFRFLILTVLDWICSRIGDEGLNQELGERFPPEAAKDICFQSMRREEPCKLEIVSLPHDGIWSASITEPDMDRNERKAVVGRSFVTNIGIRLTKNDRGEQIVILGIRIDIRDPENAPAEVPHAYRPAFIKALFLNPDIRAEQAGYPVRRGCFLLNQEAEFQKLSKTLSRRDCCLPALIFTSAFDFAAIQKALEDIDSKLGLADSKSSILNQARIIDRIPDKLGQSLLGYCRVFRVPGGAFRQFKSFFHVNEDFKPGDMLFLAPTAFSGKSAVIKYREEQARVLQEDYFQDLKETMMAYSKRKAYCFDPVVFVPEALRIQRQQRIEKVREETENLTFDQLSDIVAENEAKISRLANRVLELERENEILKRRMAQNRCDLPSVPIYVPDTEEYFPGEIRDLILTVLRAKDAAAGGSPDSRAAELLSRIVKMNEPGYEGVELFEQIKRIFAGHSNFSEGDFNSLRALGFLIEETKQGDGHTRLRFKTSPRFCSIPSTGSDVRGMKNAYAAFEKKESVYKI